MTQVIILGAGGQLGSDVVKVFGQKNIPHIGLNINEFNVETDDLEAKLAHYKAQYIINCIATTNVDQAESESKSSFIINGDFVYKLAIFCAKHNITLLHVSTDYVFDGYKLEAYLEDDQTNPLNIYGLSKLVGEIAVKQYLAPHFIFRVSSLFGIAGASGKGGNFITAMQRLAKERDTIAVIDDQITCPTSTLEVARCMSHFILTDNREYGTYHCVSSNSCSWYEFTQEIFAKSAIKPTKLKSCSFRDYNFIAMRPQYGVLNNTKLSRLYKMPSWQDSLDEYFALKV